MSRGLKILLTLALGLPLTAAVLTTFNWGIVRYALHIGQDSLEEICSRLPPIKSPLVLTASRADLLKNARDLLEAHGLNYAALDKLPKDHPFLIDIDWVARANPYPPLLAEYNDGYKAQHFSFGYLGNDEKYHQITYYGGEADTVPAFLVRKVRGTETHYGDYFVSYAFLLSRTVKEDPKWKAFPQIKRDRPQIDKIQWSSYIGGSSDQIEELLIPPLMTIVELLLVAPLAWWLLRRKRLRSA